MTKTSFGKDKPRMCCMLNAYAVCKCGFKQCKEHIVEYCWPGLKLDTSVQLYNKWRICKQCSIKGEVEEKKVEIEKPGVESHVRERIKYDI